MKNDKAGIDSADEADADSAPVDGLTKNESKQTEKSSTEFGGSRDHKNELNRGWEGVISNTRFGRDLGDLGYLTNSRILRQFERLTADVPQIDKYLNRITVSKKISQI